MEKKLQVWAGIEPTIVRVGDNYKSQLEKSNHLYRLSDIDLFGELELDAFRYPILMEQFAENGLNNIDWTWADERINKWKKYKTNLIIGLIHHGSGPSYTDLLDDNFPYLVAEYAGKVAERYPHIKSYTPINEPNTTARFSGLYKVWYPHHGDCRSYIKMLLNQCKAIVLSMKKIREINPEAELVVTEDMGKIYCTSDLFSQARFENDRRWLSLDLLTGKVDGNHPLWNHLLENDFTEDEVIWFKKNPCNPSILGINYYLTSERVLDNNIEDYPTDIMGCREYVDIEAVRVTDIAGHYGILKEVCERYNLPTALTEVHLNCDIDNQLRWLKEAWDAGNKLIKEGYDFRALTVWSLLGAYEWNSLLTRNDNFYETGAFDVSSGKPEPTQIAEMVKSLAVNGRYEHHAFRDEGWWKKSDRFLIKQPREFERF